MEVAGLKLRPIRTKPSHTSGDASVNSGEGLKGGLVRQPDPKHHARVPDVDDEDRNSVDGEADDGGGGDVANACMIHDEPVSPAARVFLDPLFNAHILVILGCRHPIDIDSLKSGIRNTILKHKRFRSVIRKNEKGDPYWIPTSVNLDEHIVIMESGDASSSTFVEDYVAQLAQAPPLDQSRPLFEFHVLRAKSGDAAENVVFRVHHSLGDGTSLMSLLLACTRKADNPNSLPTLPIQAYRSQKKRSAFKAFFLLIWRFLIVFWYTFLDMCVFTATMMWLKDSKTPLKGNPGVEKLIRRLAHQTVSMDDIKAVKHATKGTVNDVVFGMVAAGLSHYLQQKYVDDAGGEDLAAANKFFGSKHSGKRSKVKESLASLRVRACVLVNIRPSPGLHEVENMMKGGSQARWGNQMGYVILPVPLSDFENPLEYVIKAKSIIDKKKVSLGALFGYRSGTMLMKLMGSEMPTRFTLNCAFNTTLAFSNVSGPLEEVEFFGHKITHIIPTVAGQPQALCVHVQSYMGKATIVVCTAKDVIPDPERLCESIVGALKEMKERLAHELK